MSLPSTTTSKQRVANVGVGRTLLSDAFDFAFDFDLNNLGLDSKVKIKANSVGQECPTHTAYGPTKELTR